MKKQNQKQYEEIAEWLQSDRKKSCEVTKNWQPEDWEKYLKTIETGQEGRLLDPWLFDFLLDIQPPIFTLVGTTRSELNDLIEKIILSLSPKQQQVIQKLFFEGRTERRAAHELQMSRGTVRVHGKKALNRIKERLTEESPTLSIVQGLKFSQKDIFDEIDDRYWKGVISDDEFYHLWALAEVGGLKAGDLS